MRHGLKVLSTCSALVVMSLWATALGAQTVPGTRRNAREDTAHSIHRPAPTRGCHGDHRRLLQQVAALRCMKRRGSALLLASRMSLRSRSSCRLPHDHPSNRSSSRPSPRI